MPTPPRAADPHTYARDVDSKHDLCLCGWPLGWPAHTESAPGVPVPQSERQIFRIAMASALEEAMPTMFGDD